MFQNSSQWLLLVLDVSVKSLMLAIIAGSAIKFLRLRDPNIRHRILSGVLAGMLALPLLSYLLPTIPVSIPQSWTQSAGSNQIAVLDNDFSSVRSHSEFDNEDPLRPSGFKSATLGQSQSELDEARPVVLAGNEAAANAPDATRAEFASVPPVKTRFWTFKNALRIGSTTFLALWLTVAALFAIRLLLGLWSTSRLLTKATAINAELDGLVTLPDQLHVSIRETSQVCVPVTVGWIRPTILLPADWRSWTVEKLQAIVAHEFTHVARHDFVVALTAEMNRCLCLLYTSPSPRD